MNFADRLQAVADWAQTARNGNWLSDADLERLVTIETGAAADLFADRKRRPLIVGLFGGTGVGKSSLLNRLAGHTIAAVGLERPTSTSATLYLHESQTVDALPPDSPIRHTEVRYHREDARRDVAWLDMPDMDSVEQANRDQVLAWLPYVDWLIYVVSPERYRDDVGWQLLKARRHRHHWLFVVNRWDEARQVQLDEFARDLEQAGFDRPRILRTSCRGGTDYDFEALQKTIDAAIEAHGLAELQRIGLLARLRDLESAKAQFRHKLGSEEAWTRLQREIDAKVRQRLRVFADRMRPALEAVAGRYPAAPPWWRSAGDAADLPEVDLDRAVWSDYCDDLLDNIEADVVVAVKAEDMEPGPFVQMIGAAGRRAAVDALRHALLDALARPQTPAVAGLRRVLGIASYALPLGVAAWAAYNTVSRYSEGLSGRAEFLGLDFAVHSALLIGLAWFVPFLCGRGLRPSYRAAVRRGLHRGLATATSLLQQRVKDSLRSVEAERTRLLEDLPG